VTCPDPPHLFVPRCLQAKVLGNAEYQLLRKQPSAGFAIGLDVLSAEERAKREERAKKYGTEVFNYDKAPLVVAGLDEEEQKALEVARERYSLCATPWCCPPTLAPPPHAPATRDTHATPPPPPPCPRARAACFWTGHPCAWHFPCPPPSNFPSPPPHGLQGKAVWDSLRA
jgi:hypothetical protein